MKTLLLDRDHKTMAAGLVGEFADPSHATVTLSRSTAVYSPEGLVALLLRNVIPPDLHALAFELLKTVDDSVDNRITVCGSESLPRTTTIGGRPSKRCGVHEDVIKIIGARQGILGWVQPHRQTSLTSRHPEMLSGNRQLIRLVDKLHRRYLPEFYKRQRAIAERLPHCRLFGTICSTLYVPKNFRTAYHRDTGNLAGLMTALLPAGNFVGGELVLPEWGLGIAFRPGDVLFFDSRMTIHGNLPIRGERISLALYWARGLS